MKGSDIAYTPAAVAEQAVNQVVRYWGTPNTAVDVGAGYGSISDALQAHMYPDRIVPIEPRDECWERLHSRYPHAEKTTIQGFCAFGPKAWDLVIGNPPFSEISAVVNCGLELTGRQGVLCLLGLLDWGQRATKDVDRRGKPSHRAVWRATPPTHCWRIQGSVNMRHGGSGDARSYCWWIWAPGPRLTRGWITEDLELLPSAARKVTPEECGIKTKEENAA